MFQVVHHDLCPWRRSRKFAAVSLVFPWCFPLYMEFQVSNSSICPATKRNRMMLSIKDHLPIRSSAEDPRGRNPPSTKKKSHHLEILDTVPFFGLLVIPLIPMCVYMYKTINNYNTHTVYIKYILTYYIILSYCYCIKPIKSFKILEALIKKHRMPSSMVNYGCHSRTWLQPVLTIVPFCSNGMFIRVGSHYDPT